MKLMSVRSAAWLAASALLAAACSSNDRPSARESQRPGGVTTTQSGSADVASRPMAQPSAPASVPLPVAVAAPTDTAFAQKIAASNAAEIELSRIAYVRAHSPEVRDYAQQLLIDHRDMAIKLDNFALERGHLVVWRTEPDMARDIERIRTLDGAAFDKAYMDLMVEAHGRSVATLETQAASGRETAGLAITFVPAVRHHLEMARGLDAKL